MSISNPAWWTLIGAGWVFAVGPGDIEGKIAPVVNRMEIVEILEFDAATRMTTFSARALKNREASWLSTQFHYGDASGIYTPVFTKHLDRPELRPTGCLFWKRIKVNLSPDQLQNNSFATVTHDVPSSTGLWNVVSSFHDTRLDPPKDCTPKGE